MADDELRELERVWRASGVIDDGIRWHRARLRMGAIDRDGLRLEAAAGDRAAWAALDVPPLIVRLDTWLRQETPGVVEGFNQPAPEAELAETEELLGRAFPPLLRALYLWRNGQPPAWPYGVAPELELSDEQIQEYLEELVEGAGFEFDPPTSELLHLELWADGWRLLSLREVRAAWEARVRRPVSIEGEPVERPWPTTAIPFMVQAGGHLRCIDPVGVQTGVAGQIVEGQDGVERIVAHSLERWLEVFVASLEQEAWSPDGDAERASYFARAVNPGWPLEVDEEEVRLERAYYDETAGDMIGHFTICSGCLTCLGCGPALLVSFIIVVWRDGFSNGLWGGLQDVSVGVIVASALIAAPIAIYMFVDARIRHRRLTEEFRGATLDPPTDDRAG